MPDDFTFHIKAVHTRRLTEEFNDLQNEIAGLEVGKNSRFLSGSAERVRSNSRSDRKAGLTALDVLMQDATYQNAYQQTYTALRDTEALLHDAMLQSRERFEEARRALQDAKNSGANADELKRLKQDATETQSQYDQLLGYDRELQAIRDHMQDEDNPPSKEVLEDYKERIGEIQLIVNTRPEQATQLEQTPHLQPVDTFTADSPATDNKPVF